MAYTNLIRRYFKNTRPVVLGGIEASLRRIAHYDYWDNSLRRPVLFDAKADILVYGMGERQTLELAGAMKAERSWKDIRGICFIEGAGGIGRFDDYIRLPDFEEVRSDKQKFTDSFRTFYANSSQGSKGMIQKTGERFLVHNPPALPLTGDDLDKVYETHFQRDVHPFYKKMGEVRAIETIRFSITTHRGCFGECRFCSISVHQGRTVASRSPESVLREASSFNGHPAFRGTLHLAGAPTANMYLSSCSKKGSGGGHCSSRSCLIPETCPNLNFSHKSQISILEKIRGLKTVRGRFFRVFVTSGIRHDMILQDKKYGEAYLRNLIEHHTSGQMKLAPEHSDERVLWLMGKPSWEKLLRFKNIFDRLNDETGKKQFLTYYFIAAHPGCAEGEMRSLDRSVSKSLGITPEQVPDLTHPLDIFVSHVLHREDPFTGENLFIETDTNKKGKSKKQLLFQIPNKGIGALICFKSKFDNRLTYHNNTNKI